MITFEDEIPIPKTTMILDNTVFLDNIQKNEQLELLLTQRQSNNRICPSPYQNTEITVNYVAQAVCNVQPFRDLMALKYGRNISVSFEGYTYYGYINDYDIDDSEGIISFTFLYINKIKQQEGGDPWSL